MTSQRGGDTPGMMDPMRANAQMWEAGYRSLLEGWRQAQEFWTSSARSMGEVAGAWMGQMGSRTGQGQTAEGTALLRELQDAAFSVGQAWMRLPLALAGGSDPGELQEAITRLAEVQGRAYQMWLEALGRMGGQMGATMGAAGAAPAEAASTAARAAEREG